ncbi:MAG TPA: hypothetical protein V6C78_05440 [Crinalium sp.]
MSGGDRSNPRQIKHIAIIKDSNRSTQLKCFLMLCDVSQSNKCNKDSIAPFEPHNVRLKWRKKCPARKNRNSHFETNCGFCVPTGRTKTAIGGHVRASAVDLARPPICIMRMAETDA